MNWFNIVKVQPQTLVAPLWCFFLFYAARLSALCVLLIHSKQWNWTVKKKRQIYNVTSTCFFFILPFLRCFYWINDFFFVRVAFAALLIWIAAPLLNYLLLLPLLLLLLLLLLWPVPVLISLHRVHMGKHYARAKNKTFYRFFSLFSFVATNFHLFSFDIISKERATIRLNVKLKRLTTFIKES